MSSDIKFTPIIISILIVGLGVFLVIQLGSNTPSTQTPVTEKENEAPQASSTKEKKEPPEGCWYEGEELICTYPADSSTAKTTSESNKRNEDSLAKWKYKPKYEYARSGPFLYKVDGKIQFKDYLGDEPYGESASEGAVFLLVPVKVKNDTLETETENITWKVIDISKGYTYKTATGVDFKLDKEDRLNVRDIPPGITRSGYIVFEINEDSRYNDLVLSVKPFLKNELEFALNFHD